MSILNLTSRKKTIPQKVIGTFIKQLDSNNNLVYKARYSSEYKDEGHDFNKSFKVLRGAYLFRYKILSNLDISIYEMLQFLCGEEIPFSLATLADELGIGDATLRKCLDNLENAELLEIVKSDGQGNPNYYIIRTPYFLREDFKETQKARVLRKYGELPEIFLEDVAPILIRNVKKNKVKKIRTLERSKFLGKRKQIVKKIIDDLKESRRRVWHRIVKTLGNQNAINFDSIVWKICHNTDLLKMYGKEFEQAFKRHLKFECERLNIFWNEFLFDLANDLRAFYDARLNIRQPQPDKGKPTPPTPPASPATLPVAASFEEKEKEKEALRQFLEEKRNKNILPRTSQQLKQFIGNCSLGHNSFNELLAVVKEFFAPDVWEKLTVELRN